MPVRARRLTAADRNLFLWATPVLLDVISTRLGRTLRGVPDLRTLITNRAFSLAPFYITDDVSLSRAVAKVDDPLHICLDYRHPFATDTHWLLVLYFS